MDVKIKPSFEEQINAYLVKNQKILLFNDAQEIREAAKSPLEVFLCGRPAFCKSDAAKSFSVLLGRKISDEDIVFLTGKPKRIPEVPSFAYNMDHRGWLYIEQHERKVFFVDDVMHRFDPNEGEIQLSGNWKYYLLGIIIAVIITAIILCIFPR